MSTPGVQNPATDDAIARSQLATSWQPAALATPCTAAMTGRGRRTIDCMSAQQVIANVQGAATAAGCQRVAQCDLAITADTAKFVTSGVTWGFFCSTPGVAIGRNLHRKHAMEMLLTGEPIDARRALEWGLVNRIVPPENLDAAVYELAKKISDKPPATVAAGKRAFYTQMDLGLTKAYELASSVIAQSFAGEEGRAGMDAFIEKRPPRRSPAPPRPCSRRRRPVPTQARHCWPR